LCTCDQALLLVSARSHRGGGTRRAARFGTVSAFFPVELCVPLAPSRRHAAGGSVQRRNKKGRHARESVRFFYTWPGSLSPVSPQRWCFPHLGLAQSRRSVRARAGPKRHRWHRNCYAALGVTATHREGAPLLRAAPLGLWPNYGSPTSPLECEAARVRHGARPGSAAYTDSPRASEVARVAGTPHSLFPHEKISSCKQ